MSTSALAFAQGEADSVTGDVALSGSRTTGNTETTDVGLAGKLEWMTGLWEQDFRATADFGRQDGTTNKERFQLGYTLSRNFDNKFYVYGNADHFQHAFGAYKYGYFLGVGVGYQAYEGETLNWELEAGPGYRRQKTREAIGSGPASLIEDSIAARAQSDLKWTINDKVSAYNLTEIVSSSDNTYIWNDVGLTADLFGSLAARVSFRVDHNTDVPLGRENTDTISRVGVVYKIE